jgi:hypothetical protein
MFKYGLRKGYPSIPSPWIPIPDDQPGNTVKRTFAQGAFLSFITPLGTNIHLYGAAFNSVYTVSHNGEDSGPLTQNDPNLPLVSFTSTEYRYHSIGLTVLKPLPELRFDRLELTLKIPLCVYRPRCLKLLIEFFSIGSQTTSSPILMTGPLKGPGPLPLFRPVRNQIEGEPRN